MSDGAAAVVGASEDDSDGPSSDTDSDGVSNAELAVSATAAALELSSAAADGHSVVGPSTALTGSRSEPPPNTPSCHMAISATTPENAPRIWSSRPCRRPRPGGSASDLCIRPPSNEDALAGPQ
ncbi:hypothetical protein [Glycomyces sp. NPDC047010]|uniref:hypothetical protein n=1 Tax=Glycomyces sp. NPDC047010 TaxID=3155023 RepID=UPI0033E5C01D